MLMWHSSVLFCFLAGSSSAASPLNHGVSRHSVLSPLIFSFYVLSQFWVPSSTPKASNNTTIDGPQPNTIYLQFSNYAMVQAGYTFSRNHTANCECCSFPGLGYVVRYTVSSDREPQLPVSCKIMRSNTPYYSVLVAKLRCSIGTFNMQHFQLMIHLFGECSPTVSQNALFDDDFKLLLNSEHITS
jgi:hypothetical protein